MFGISNLPQAKNVERFIAPIESAAVTNTRWIAWTRPKNATMLYFLTIGGGAGGGGASNITPYRGGGAGGGSGGMASLLIPATFLPRTIFLRPGQGGQGGSAGSAGTQGFRSFVCDTPSTITPPSTASIIVCSGSLSATGGSQGSSSGSSVAGGSGELLASISISTYASLGVWRAVAGQNGGSSGNNAAGGSVMLSNGLVTTGGGGGASTDGSEATSFNGGNVTGVGVFPSLTQLVTLGGVNGGDGAPGFSSWEPFIQLGAGGGANSITVNGGGQGGQGGIGCGGGGGGGANSTTTGARASGGSGGPGMVLVAWW